MRNAAIALISFGIVIAVGSLFLTLKMFLDPVLSLFDPSGLKDLSEHYNLGMFILFIASSVPRVFPSALWYIRSSLQNMFLGTFIFPVVLTKQTIRRNDFEKTTTDWTYEQMVVVILLFQQIIDIGSTYTEKQENKQSESERQGAKTTDSV